MRRDGPGAGRGVPPAANPRPLPTAPLKWPPRSPSSAPPAPGRHTPNRGTPRSRGALRPPCRGAALLSPERGGAGARVGEGGLSRAAARVGEAGAPRLAGLRGRRTRSLLTAGRVNKGRRPPAHGAAAAGGASPRPCSHRGRGGSPARHSANRSASPRCSRCLGGTRRRVSRRAEGAAPPLTETRPLLPSPPPARPHLELALPPRSAAAASPARHCAPLLSPWRLAPPRGRWPAQPSPPLPCCGCCVSRPPLQGSRSGDCRAGGEDRRGAEPPAARAARCICVSGDGLGFVLRFSLPAERRAVIVRPARQGGEAPRLNVTAPRPLPAATPRIAHLGRGP